MSTDSLWVSLTAYWSGPDSNEGLWFCSTVVLEAESPVLLQADVEGLPVSFEKGLTESPSFFLMTRLGLIIFSFLYL